MFHVTAILTLTAITSPQVRLEPVHTSLKFTSPVQVVFDGVHNDRMFVVEKEGVVRRVSTKKNTSEKPIYLDIRNRIGERHDEEGLLSLAFHPNFKKNGEMYVWYTAHRPRRAVLSKFRGCTECFGNAWAESEEVLLEVDQPWGNHNGGTVVFGPDGYLYVGIGDGGAANDPHGHGQNKNTLLGTIIRIDVNNKSEDRPYAIPPNNPLIGVDGAREEIWAWGLRNPWRMHFDRETGDLWTGDVGQNAWEEIDVVVRGGNYGWNVREGNHKFQGDQSEKESMIDPVFEYGRREGGSITGGHVYRGGDIPGLVGKYIYADYISKRVWTLFGHDINAKSTSERIAPTTPLAVSSFGETPEGEILACGFGDPYMSVGKIYRLVPADEEDLSDPTTDSIR